MKKKRYRIVEGHELPFTLDRAREQPMYTFNSKDNVHILVAGSDMWLEFKDGSLHKTIDNPKGYIHYGWIKSCR